MRMRPIIMLAKTVGLCGIFEFIARVVLSLLCYRLLSVSLRLSFMCVGSSATLVLRLLINLCQIR